MYQRSSEQAAAAAQAASAGRRESHHFRMTHFLAAYYYNDTEHAISMRSKDDTSEFVRSSQTKGRRRHSYSRVDGEHELRKLEYQLDKIMQQPSFTKNTRVRKKKERSKSAPRTSRAPSKYEEDNVDEKLHDTKRALKSTRKKLSAQQERHSKEIQALAAQVAQLRSELLAVSTSQIQMPATDLLENYSESVLDDSDYKIMKREDTRPTLRVVRFSEKLEESARTISTYSGSTISEDSSSRRR
eukprot:scaffold19206_cov47-Attheya_sp.AAC.1